MESFFSRYRNALVLITVLVAQVIGLAVQVRRPGTNPGDKEGVRLIRAWVVGVVAPPERLLHATGLGIRGVWNNYFDLIHIRQQNKELQAQVDRLRLEEASIAEDARQAQRLQALLGFREKYIYKTVAAQVVGTAGTEQSRVLLIDKGAKDGIRQDMPVITPDGIVGKTRDVFAHTSQVLEISDSSSGAGVMLEKTRIRGVLRGNSWGQPEIVNVSPDERIKPGETVLTSGGDAIFPRGLAVGTVDRVAPDPDGTLVNVLIRPAANLSRLEEVLVITSTGDQMPAAMQEDLADAEQKASDVLAERLPSREDPNASPDQKQEQAASQNEDNEGRPMRPPAALHPDKYTPNDTPPAADLVPGQRLANGASGTGAGAAETGGTSAQQPSGHEAAARTGTAPRSASQTLPGASPSETGAARRPSSAGSMAAGRLPGGTANPGSGARPDSAATAAPVGTTSNPAAGTVPAATPAARKPKPQPAEPQAGTGQAVTPSHPTPRQQSGRQDADSQSHPQENSTPQGRN
jgi:rod shape-determining protein MreC